VRAGAAGEEPRRVQYSGPELWELELAWATTVHKAQGSEARAVVLALAPSHRPLLTRRLLYTGARGLRPVPSTAPAPRGRGLSLSGCELRRRDCPCIEHAHLAVVMLGGAGPVAAAGRLWQPSQAARSLLAPDAAGLPDPALPPHAATGPASATH
jgi:hypothetical protein